jgi:FtsH-binding integral membrane protein
VNKIYLTLFKSLIITVLVAGIVSYFLLFFNIPLYGSFPFLIVIQFLFFYFFGEFQKNKRNNLKIQADLKLIEEINKQSMEVTCPCDRNIKSLVPINLNSDNNYTCPGCNKNISIFISTKTALTTTPITVNPLEAPIFVDSLKNIIKNVENANN